MSDSEESVVSDAASEQSPAEEEDYDDEEDEDNDKPSRKRKKLNIFDATDVDNKSDETGEKWGEGAEDIIDCKSVHEGPSAENIKGKQQLEHIMNCDKEDKIEENYYQKYTESPKEFGKVEEMPDEISRQELLPGVNCDKEDKTEENYCPKYAESPKEFGKVEEISDEISQQELLPDVKDLNMWMVRCRMGEEKSTAVLLMRKFFTYQFTEEPLQIKSVIAKEGLKGYIYIEAFKHTHVKQAIEGVGSLRMGRFEQKLVPIEEMTDVLKVIPKSTNLKPNSWVRLKRGIYQDDLAQVEYVKFDNELIHLKLLPRIDYRIYRGKMRSLNSPRIYNEYGWRKRRNVKQKLLDIDALKAIGGEVTVDGDFFNFEGNRYDKKGFLHKTFAISGVTEDEVKPTASEIENFEKGIGINLDPFIPGDKVRVHKEGFSFLEGKVITFDANKVTIMPKSEDLKEPLEFETDDVCKHFEVGDHVKVLCGYPTNNTGIVVDVEDMVILFSDSTMTEINVWHDDLQLCTDLEDEAAVLATNCSICSVLGLNREDSDSF